MYRNGLFFALLFVCSFAVSPLAVGQEIQAVIEIDDATEINNATEPEEAAESRSPFEFLAPPDRNTMRRFEQAKRLIEANRLPEAAQLLGAVLESSADFFLPPKNDQTERTSLQTFSGLVLQTLLGLPNKARESYRAQYETLAERLLNNAVQNGSIEEIQIITQRYAPTQAGRTALFLLGLNQFETGTYQPALLTLQKLNRSPGDLTSFEPTLSLTLAACALRSGQKIEAEQFAQQLFQRQAKPEILLSGKELWKPENAADVLNRLEKMQEQTPKIKPAAWLEQTGWQLSSGAAHQNPETAATKPLLDFVWTVPTLSRQALNDGAKNLIDFSRRNKEVLMPAGQPILVDGKLIFRSMKDNLEMIAVDVQTGKRLWTATEPEFSLAVNIPHNFPIPFAFPRMPGGQNNHSFLQLFLWHEKLDSQFSSDGQQLFSIERSRSFGLAMMGMMGGMVQQQIQINGKTMDDPQAGPGNTLTARNIDTGRVLWHAGKFPYAQKKYDLFFREVIEEKQKNAASKKPTEEQQAQQKEPQRDEAFSEEELFLAETWFLGAPLPLHGRLYVLGENAGIIRLIVLDAATGRFLRQQPLATPPSSFESDAVRRMYALTPSESNGIILCPTGTGMVFAVDATTAAPLWSFSYWEPLPDTEDGNRQRRNFQRFGLGGRINSPQQLIRSRWQIPSLMIDGNRAVITPADDSGVYCLDVMTGKLLWQKKDVPQTDPKNPVSVPVTTAVSLPAPVSVPNRSPLYAACIYNETVYLIYDNSISALALDTGKERDLSLPTEFSYTPSGRGVRSGHQYFLPLSGGVLGVLDLDKGSLEYLAAQQKTFAQAIQKNEEQLESDPTDSFFDDSIELGNLIGIQGRFFSQSPLEIACFDQLEPLQKRTDALLQTNADDATGLYQLGRIKRSENDFTAAADLFRRSHQSQPTEWSADALRQTLLKLIHSNYTESSRYGTELESLAEFPEELGEILFVLARGAIQTGNLEEMLDKIQKAFFLEQNDAILVPLSPQHSARLHTALGILLQESVKNPPKVNSGDSWNSQLNTSAETLLNETLSNKENDLPSVRKLAALSLPKQEWENTALPSDIQSLRTLSTVFQSLPIASKIESLLIPKLKQQQFALAAEMLIQSRSQTPTADELRTLANLFADQDNIADALYYEQQIAATGNEEDKKRFQSFIERPDVQKCFARYYTPVSFPNGVVQVTEEEPVGFQANQQDTRSLTVERILQEANRKHGQAGIMSVNRQTIPFHGSYDPFLSSLSFVLEVYHPEFYLVCSDSYGKEIWRSSLSEVLNNENSGFWHNDYYSFTQNGFFDEMVYLKGWNHLLILVQPNALVAFDTSQCDTETGPKILWTKTLTEPMPIRQSHSALSFNQLIGISESSFNGFPKEPLFVSPQVVCYRDSNKIYGLDPLSGETMWVRRMESSLCSFLGDRDHLFLVFSDTRRVLTVNPLNGSELESGTIPQGGVFTFGTQIVFVKQIQQVRGAERVFPYQLHVCDLKNLYDKRRRALLISDGGDTDEGTLPTVPVFTQLSHETLIRQVHYGRFLCSAPWESHTVQLFDLQEGKNVWGGNGVKLPNKVINDKNLRWDSDIDVEQIDDNFLITFIEKGQVDQTENIVEGGIKTTRHRQVVTGIPFRNVGNASMMLYGADGRALWKEPARIENLYRMLCLPQRSPVALFTAIFRDVVPGDNSGRLQSTAIQAIDKRTGETRFRKTIPIVTRNRQEILLQGFRVEVEPDAKAVSFISPARKVNAVFTDKMQADKPDASTAKAEKKTLGE